MITTLALIPFAAGALASVWAIGAAIRHEAAEIRRLARQMAAPAEITVTFKEF